MREIIIQEQIVVTQEFVDRVIEEYKKYPDTFKLGILGVILDKERIIREIIKLTDIGKKILLMHYEYEKYLKSSKPSLNSSSKKDCLLNSNHTDY